MQAVRADDLEEIRAETLIRLCEIVAASPSAAGEAMDASGEFVPSVASLRRAVSMAVHRHFCREIRRRRAVRFHAIEDEGPIPANLDPEGDRDDEPAELDPPRSVLTVGGHVKPFVMTARARATRALSSLSEALLQRRAGIAPSAAERRILGIVRWFRRYENDHDAANAARDLIESGCQDRVAGPHTLVEALRASAEWDCPALGLARLAHTAIVTPGAAGPRQADGSR